MQLLYILEQLRTPAVTKALSALTYFGGVYGFMVLSIIIFWCIDKRCGYFMLSLGCPLSCLGRPTTIMSTCSVAT